MDTYGRYGRYILIWNWNIWIFMECMIDMENKDTHGMYGLFWNIWIDMKDLEQGSRH